MPISEADEPEVEPASFSGGLPQVKQVEPSPVSGGYPFGIQGKQVESALGSDTFKSIDAVDPAKHSEFEVEPDTQNADKEFTRSSGQKPPLPPATQAPEDTARSVPVRKWAEMTDTLEERASEIVMARLNSGSVPADQNPGAPPPNSKVAALKPLQTSQSKPLPSPEGPISPVASVGPASVVNAAESAAPATSSPAPSVPDPALVEAVVQRVLDKMRPQVVDIITREFLRPVVQALVHREIEKQ
jgi:hypothetical protein